MRKEEAFEFLCRLAQGIASMFGDSCETVVHEMEGERMKNLVIFNGHVSGRSAGSTLSIYGRDTIQDDPEGTSLDQDFLNQMVVTPSGKNIKSSTFHLRGEGYHYALGINYDVSVMGAMRRLLENFTESSGSLLDSISEDRSDFSDAQGRPNGAGGPAEREGDFPPAAQRPLCGRAYGCIQIYDLQLPQ